jgi:phage tail sheath protein FI
MSANQLSAGVFIEEVPSSVQTITSASTSNFGVVGFTPSGRTNKATLVRSWNEFYNTFGGLSKNSYTGYVLAAFFNNGGQTAYVVRVTPSDSASATGGIQSQTLNQPLLATYPDGATTTFTATAAASLLKDNGGLSPIIPGSVSLKWRGAGVALTAQALYKRDGVTLVPATAALNYIEFRVNPASIPALDPTLMAVVPTATTTKFYWTVTGSVAKFITLTPPTVGNSVTTTTTADGTVIFDFKTGIGSLNSTLATTAVAPTMDFTPASVTRTIVDDSLGGLYSTLLPSAAGPNLLSAGTIGYADGSYSFTTVSADATVKPHINGPILASYKIKDFSISPTGAGVWGNSIQTSIYPTDPLQSSTTAPTSFTFKVSLKNTDGSFTTKEVFEGLSFSDPTSSTYFPAVTNEQSSFVTVSTTNVGNEAPGQLIGATYSYAVGGGDSLALSYTALPFFFGANVGGGIQKRSVVVSYTDTAGVARSFTDDGQNGFTNNSVTVNPGLDTTTPSLNVCSYTGTSGNSFILAAAPKAGSLVTVSYRLAATESAHTEMLGDTTLGYTAGSDGTFTSGTYGASQMTTLSAPIGSTYGGIYAFNKIDDIINIAVPDLTGDVTATQDLLAYADSRALLPKGGDRFVLLAPPKGSTAAVAGDWLQYKVATRSKFAAIYWPWVKVSDPLAASVGTGTRNIIIPNCGSVAGAYARTDSTKNVGKAAAGTVDGQLKGITDLEFQVTRDDTDLVYPKLINPLVNWTQTGGMVIWGARTFSSEAIWRYVQARRLFMYCEYSVWSSTHWIVFENNGPALWNRIKGQLNGFLTSLFNAGYFAGARASQAFYVICDESNNTPTTIAQGKVIIDVGIAPNKPAEFVTFRFSSITST